VLIRPEMPFDAAEIARVIASAFAGQPNSNGAEPGIVAGLREAGALTLSLIASDQERIVGHVAFSPVVIAGDAASWFGLGPLAVEPSMQGKGVGAALVTQGLARLRSFGAAGCVVLGDPAYYGRFAFRVCDKLTLPGVPPEYFMGLAFAGEVPRGKVAYHAAFNSEA